MINFVVRGVFILSMDNRCGETYMDVDDYSGEYDPCLFIKTCNLKTIVMGMPVNLCNHVFSAMCFIL